MGMLQNIRNEGHFPFTTATKFDNPQQQITPKPNPAQVALSL